MVSRIVLPLPGIRFILCFLVTDAAREIVGTRTHIRKPWLSPAASAIIDQKAAARKRGDLAERKRLHKAFKTKAKEDREAFISRTIEEVEEGIKSNHLGPAFKAIKVLAGGKSSQAMSFINKADGSPCASFDETLCRWREHFEAALNHPPGTQSDELDTDADNTTVDPDTPVTCIGYVTTLCLKKRDPDIIDCNFGKD